MHPSMKAVHQLWVGAGISVYNYDDIVLFQ